MKTQTKISALVLATVRMLFLACIASILLVFLAPMGARPAEQEAEVVATKPVSSPDPDVVALAVAEIPATLEPTPISKPDKPVYDPAIPLSEDLQYILLAACEEHDVEPAIALGLIEVESGFDPSADSGLCYGLMQLNRNYFQSDLPPDENIRYGVEYLGRLLARYSTVEAALTVYNAGHDTGARGYANAVLAAAEKWRSTNG